MNILFCSAWCIMTLSCFTKGSMRLTYSHVCSYENKYNLIGGNALNNLKKINPTIFHEVISLFSHE